MKYKDYYASLGIARDADAATVKTSYRRLARLYHPDVSKEPDAEEKFKEVAEAYRTLKDPEARTAYDRLGTRAAGQDFEPAPDWQQEFSPGAFGFGDAELADLFASLRAGGLHGRGAGGPQAKDGEDFEVQLMLSLEEAFAGRTVVLDLMMPEYDPQGRMRRVATTVRARIPAGATEGQRLRVPGKGGPGIGNGRAGDLYLNIGFAPHSLFRVSDHDVFLDVPVTPWEAVLGASIPIPTLGGEVRLRIPPGTQGGQLLRLPGRGLPRNRHDPGDQFALIQLALPPAASEAERKLYQELAGLSRFDPRAAWTAPGKA